MHEPYKMVLVNLIASCILLCGIIIFKKVYPKKNINFFILLLLISVLPILSIFRPGDYESGDFNIHIYRIMAFYDSLKEGILMPSWAGNLNATYGNPLFLFNYSLPYYFISIFHFLGFSFISSMKIYLGLTLYVSGIFMYLWIKKLTNNQLAAFTTSIFYIFNPYHLIDVHFRATLGESTIFTLVPLLLLFLTKYLKEKKLIFLVWIAFISQLLFLAHPMVAGIFLVITICFILFQTDVKNKLKNILLPVSALCFGAFASIYSWFSFLYYAPYVFVYPGGIQLQFDTLAQVLYAPWRLGFLFQGPQGQLAPIIGYTQLFIIIFSIFLLVKNKFSKKIKKNVIFWFCVLAIILFLMTPASIFFWKSFPFIAMLQSNRLLLPIALATSVLAGYISLTVATTNKKKLLIYLLIFITIGYTILNWGHRRVIPEITDNILMKNVWSSTLYEGTTAYFLNNKWADINNFWFSKLPAKHIEIIQGDATIIELKRSSIKHEYLVDAKTSVAIQENTLFYPGWSMSSNYKQIHITPGKRGVINALLPKGQQYVTLSYSDLPIYALTKLISGLSFVVMVCVLLFYYLRRKLQA